MIEEQNPNNEQQHEESINFYAIFFKYLAYWPWFVASVIVCLILAFVYLRYQPPVYNVTSAVLIKEDVPASAAWEQHPEHSRPCRAWADYP